jgi:hypothetical protein
MLRFLPLSSASAAAHIPHVLLHRHSHHRQGHGVDNWKNRIPTAGHTSGTHEAGPLLKERTTKQATLR